MDRKEFLTLCQKNAVLDRSGHKVCVLFGDKEYIPKELVIKFDRHGQTKNVAVLKDKRANSVINCLVEEVSLA